MDVLRYRQWLAELGLSANTINQRADFFEWRLRSWGTFDVPAHQVTEWLNDHVGWTRLTYFNHLTSIYGWLNEIAPGHPNPLARFKRPRRPRPHASPLLDEEIDAALSTTTGDLRAWISLGYLAGLRAHEIAKIRGEDIDQVTLHVIGKGGLEAWLPTHPDLWAIAKSYPREGYWFPSVQAKRQHVSAGLIGMRVREHFRDLGITKGATHRLRHTYATHLSRNGVPTAVIQLMLRHQSIATTEAYIGVSAAELADAVRTLLPSLPGSAPGKAA